MEKRIVQCQCRVNEFWFRKLDVGEPVCNYEESTGKECQGNLVEYPFGWPVNLSQRMVMRLMVPHAWKWAWISSAVAL